MSKRTVIQDLVNLLPDHTLDDVYNLLTHLIAESDQKEIFFKWFIETATKDQLIKFESMLIKENNDSGFKALILATRNHINEMN